jgi:streptothricin acetyltransferase
MDEKQEVDVTRGNGYRAVGFEIDAVDPSYYTNHDAPDGEVAIFMKRKVEF